MRAITRNCGVIIILSLVFACKKDSNLATSDGNNDHLTLSEYLNLPESPYNYANVSLPAHFNAANVRNADNTPGGNPITDRGATLGRVLFYDRSMSFNNTISCASCHLQANAFTDPARFSTGFDGGLTGRNSMSLSNAKYYENGHFFWDERANTLEDQTLMPIQDAVEMGMTLELLEERLQEKEYYKILFNDAFGSEEVTSEKIARALSQFIRSMVSYQSKLDEGLILAQGPGGNANLSNFTAEENLGRRIFNGPQGGCSGCHTGNLQIMTEARNIGLDLVYTDNGLGNVTGNPTDNGKFKSPSLRNVALTGPFMHDGRFATLREVIDHYDNGVENHPNLDPRLRVPGTDQIRRLNLTNAQKDALEAYLNTLTDNDFVTDVRFSDPFL